MEKPKILYITQEIAPYMDETELSIRSRYLPQKMQEKGYEIRTFMPKYGCINERRNQLHEVIRLSGINIIIDQADHSLLIKVASIQLARMQIYFIDNEDFFHGRSMFADDNNKVFDDNDERIMFFSKGVAETIKKLRWIPDIVHCKGWFTSLIPLFLKSKYKDDPVFKNAKIIYSAYDDNQVEHPLSNKLPDKLRLEDGVNEFNLDLLSEINWLNLNKFATSMADGVVIGNENVSPKLDEFIQSLDKPTLNYQSEDKIVKEYDKFYKQFL